MSVLLIDLSSIVYPLFHMSGKEPDPDWTSTQAVARVHGLASSFPHVAVCVDGSRSFRKDIAPTYKANRPDKDSVLIHQLRLTEERLKADGFPIWKATGFEADDVIASAVNALYRPDGSITIATSDKDLLQLVCDGVSALAVMNGGKILDSAAVVEKFGVRPDQMRDYLTLVGDSSDNITGVAGIGPKKAADILSRFDRLDAVLDQLSRGAGALGLQPAVYKALSESADQINIARELITLRADVPLEFQDIYRERQRAEQSPNEDTMSEPLESPATIVDETQPEQAPSQDVTKTSEGMAIATRVDVEPFTGAWERQLEPRNPADARTIAKWVHTSRLFAQFGTAEAVFSVVLAGRELGLGTMASLRGFHVVEGKPTMASDLIRALVLASGKAEYFVCKERTDTQATWETKRKGDPYPVELTFTWDEAVNSGVVRPNSAWAKHKKDMIAKTASSKLSRLVYSDVTFGLYSTEELGGEE